MITYNPKDWIKLILQFHKSDTFRTLFFSMVYIGIYAAIVVYLEKNYFNTVMKNPTVMHSILGFVLSLLLVFRTNSAYDRWWEGRKIWGSYVNNARNLSLKLSVLVKLKSDKEEFKNLIVNYLFATKNHLRDKYVQSEFINVKSFTLSEFADSNHKPNLIAYHLYKKIYQLHKNKEIDGYELITLNAEIKSFTDNCGACERIKKTPIPYSYNIFLKKMIFLYCISLPIFFGGEYGYVTIAITIIVLYVFASIELIAEEIEDPFQEDDNDLPLDDICNSVKNNLNEILN